MFPKPLPTEPGCLSILLHPGTFQSALTFYPVVNGALGAGIPLAGTCGTNDPAIWRHVIWSPSGVFTADLKSDTSGHHVSLGQLFLHCATHPSMWKEIHQAA